MSAHTFSVRCLLRTLFALLTCGTSIQLTAAPFIPTDDAQVLERLPINGSPYAGRMRSLRAALARSPQDLSLAAAMAKTYIEASRSEGDPRYLGYAQSALSPWWTQPDPPTPALLLRATILQSMHDFDRALGDLDKVLQREPRNAQALLTRATVLQVQGKFARARADCLQLQGLVPPIYVVVCIAAVDAMTGKAEPALKTLTEALAALGGSASPAASWAFTLAGEIAARIGKNRDAESHFRAALAIDKDDVYLKAAYADWLLDQRRAPDVLALIAADTRIDTLLLRRALAENALNRATESAITMGARIEASQARGDNTHRREEARYYLDLSLDPSRALTLAVQNWLVQREAADLRLLAETALAVNDPSALATVRTFMQETGLEYPRVAAILKAGDAAQATAQGKRKDGAR